MAKKLPLITDVDNVPEAALVPVEEQPYEIPSHWKWVRLGSVVEVNPKKDKLAHLAPELEVSFVPMAAVSAESGSVVTMETRKLGSVIKGYTNFREGDVLFAKITPCMENGKAAIVPPLNNQIGYGSTEFFVLRPSPVVQATLIHTWIRQRSYRLDAEYNMTGAVGQQRVPKAFVEASPFPLPPLEEQQEIVKYIEQINAKVDDVIQRLEQYVEEAPVRRNELIQAGVSGLLTTDWREARKLSEGSWLSTTLGDLCTEVTGNTPSTKNPDKDGAPIPAIKSTDLDQHSSPHSVNSRTSKTPKKHFPLITDFDNIPEAALVPEGEQPYEIPNNWKWVLLGSVARFIGGGTPDKSVPGFWDGEIPWASVKDLRGPTLSSTQDAISHSGLRNSSAQLCDVGDLILVTRIVPGKSAVADRQLAINQDLKIVKTRLLLPRYLQLYFSSQIGWFEAHSSGSTVMGIRITSLNGLPVPLPTLDEQKRIVGYLEKTSCKTDEVMRLVQEVHGNLTTARSQIATAALAGVLGS